MSCLDSGSVTSNTAKMLLLIGVLLQSGCSVFGVHGVEEAAYDVVGSEDGYQLRRYQPMVIAATSVEGDFDAAGGVAFKRLFAYISGANSGNREVAMTTPVVARGDDSVEIDMTAPVTAEKSPQGWSFAFILPAALTLADAPRPTSDQVRLEALPARTVAVLEYSGSWSESRYRENLARLRGWIQRNGLEAVSDPRIASYDPPWTLPFLRRNEILIDVAG